MSNRYSMWSVVFVSYIMSPWRCMEEIFSMLSLLFPSPQALGRDIDVYLHPLIEELKEL